MNIVISDSTALIIFAKSNTLHFLSNLFEKVYIPQAVYDELNFKDDIVKYRIEKFDVGWLYLIEANIRFNITEKNQKVKY